MRSIIERIATGPEMSKDISEAEAYQGMKAVLDGEVSDVRAALFLIALRMKRETREENLGVFRALTDSTVRVGADVDELVTLADPFNGFNRGLPMSPFLPAVMAACGAPCLSLGMETVAPKLGLTHHHVLAAAGRSVSLAPARAAGQIEDPGIGWAYLDQSVFHPGLYRLRALREQMVKRPLLSTCEVVLRPIVPRRRSVAWVGYVHKNYPPIYAMLARAAGHDAAVIVKGAEGGIIPSLQATSRLYRADAGEAGEPTSLKPDTAGIRKAVSRQVPAPFDDIGRNSERAAELGRAALDGKPGPARDSLVYGAAVALLALGRSRSLEAASATVCRTLDSGEARARFDRAG